MNLSQTSCLALLKGVDDLVKLYGGAVVAVLINVLLWIFGSYFLERVDELAVVLFLITPI